MQKELQKFGLSEKEAKVYLATLELGQGTAQEISSKAGVNRATTYVQIESLKTRGLVSQVTIGKKTIFMAESPENVSKMIAKEKIDVLFKEKELNKILPNLEFLYKSNENRPNVRFFEGKAGVDSCRQEVIKHPPEKYYVISPILDIDEIETEEEMTYADREELIMSQVRAVKDHEAIYVAEQKLKFFSNLTKKHKDLKIRYLPWAKLNIYTEIIVLDNKLWMSNFTGPTLGVLIEDKVIAQSFESIFRLFWSIAEQI